MPRRRRPRQHHHLAPHKGLSIGDRQGGSFEGEDSSHQQQDASINRSFDLSYEQPQQQYHNFPTGLPQHAQSSFQQQYGSMASLRGRSYIRGRRGGSSVSQSRSRSRSKSDRGSDSNTGSQAAYYSGPNTELLNRVGNRALALSRASSSVASVSSSIGSSSDIQSYMGNIQADDTKGVKPGEATRSIPSSPTSNTSSGGATQQPSTSQMPQNLRGDPFRSAKIKTELCRHFMSSKGCIFGDKCNYAHGDHELKYTTLMDLQRAGLVDVNTFRTHPCPTWVAVGSCPFDLRCPFLHDARIASSHQSWLPHAETVVSSIDTNANVDKLYHRRTRNVFNNTPFPDFYDKTRGWTLQNISDTDKLWDVFYKYVCNIDTAPQRQVASAAMPQDQGHPLSFMFSTQSVQVSEIYRVAISLHMRRKKMGVSYIYHPTHVIYGELCMILQSCAYRIHEECQDFTELTNLVEESLPSSYENALKQEEPSAFDFGIEKDLIVAHEVVFGPVNDQNSRQISICFNIPINELSKCSPQQAKRHKRSRNRSHKVASKEKDLQSALPNTCVVIESNNQDYDLHKSAPFYENQPGDNDAFDLVSDVLSLRLHHLMNSTRKQNDYESLLFVEEEEQRLKLRFESQLRFWMTWAWPLILSGDDVDENTQIPPVSEIYRFEVGGDSSTSSKDRVDYGKLATGFIWISFVMNFLNDPAIFFDREKKHYMPSHSDYFASLPRLPVFRSLSLGESLYSPDSILLPLLPKEIDTKIEEFLEMSVQDRVCSFKSLFDFFSIVQKHYSLRNTSIDKSDEVSSQISSPSGTTDIGQEHDISAAISWTRLFLSN